jgi:plastocyanin
MNRYWTSLAMLGMILAGNAPVNAHEGHRHGAQKTASPEIENTGPPSPPAANVTVKLFQYQPGRIQVKAGTTVTWVNEDEIFHTVTADIKSGVFGAPLDGKGKSFSFMFSQPGIYSYYCARHDHMRGEVEVR